VRLADGSQRNEGRVEYCIGGVWKILCSDFFHKSDAEVVCGQLGYEKIASEYTNTALICNGSYCSYFILTDKSVELIENDPAINTGHLERGRSTELSYSYDFRCDGSETGLSECSKSRLGFFDCFFAGIGVRCPLPGKGGLIDCH